MGALIAIIIAYLLGSISFSILLSKLLKTPDPRTEGSQNAGATNVLRIAGKNQAIAVLIGDILKGFIAVKIGQIFGVSGFMLGVVSIAAVLGHLFPIWFGFKGGKGVATAIGGVAGLSFISGILIAIIWFAVAFVSKYSSLASLVSVILAPIFLLIFSQFAYFIPTVIIALLIVWKHKNNIERLKNNTESKIQL